MFTPPSTLFIQSEIHPISFYLYTELMRYGRNRTTTTTHTEPYNAIFAESNASKSATALYDLNTGLK